LIASLASIAGLELRELVWRNIRTVMLLAGAAVFFLGGAAYGLSALSRELSERYGALHADLMMGGSLSLIGVVVVLVAGMLHRRRRLSVARKELMLAALPLALGVGSKLAPSLLKTAPLVLLAGILVGRALSSRE
jgi:xanthine/uracil permease